MRHRELAATVRSLLRDFPTVALLGSRQSGKPTLARTLGSNYYDLEDEGERTRLDAEWPDMERSHGLVILDEAQTHPPLFPRLRGAIDRDRRRNGRFLLLGSVSPTLMRSVSESLAGRLAVTELSPFLLSELPASSRERLWTVGGYPDGGVLGGKAYPRWQEEYLRLLVQRDLPDWGLTSRPNVTARLLKMLAAIHAQVWNASELGRSLGLTYHTVNGYLDFLEGAYLIRRLPAFHSNIRKRLVKSPKVYWRDSGLLHSLLGWSPAGRLLDQPWVGASWEGFVIEQALGSLQARGRSFEAFFLRSQKGEEIDLILEYARERWAIEIKLTASPSPAELERLDRTAALIGASRRILVSRKAGLHGGRGRYLVDLPGLLSLLA
ncbi:MAG: ATP-binding protein [bacterium]